MPDYSACSQTTCERRHGCARYRMRHGRWQSVLQPNPAACLDFWSVEKGSPFALLSPEEADRQAGLFDEPPEVFVPCDDGAGGAT